ncbi:MAG: TonB-dependent receptor, partial [Oceanicaulis sp.]
MKIRHSLFAGAALLTGVSALPLAAVHAQEAEAAPAQARDVVTVTARRREESIQDAPVAVTAVSGESLAAIGAINLTDVQKLTPNATIETARGTNSTLIAFIRGVGQQDPLWGFEPGVGLYVDDVYVARPQGAVLDIFDIERIEVLRGPQGTLYGRNTIGGAIKYVTERLSDEPEFEAGLSYGSYNQIDAVVSGSVPVTDTFAVGGALARYTRDGFGENLFSGAEHYNKDIW